LITAGSVFAGFDTFLGPIYLAVGLAEGGTHAIYLHMGSAFRRLPRR
jgi:NTE family protein